MTIRLIILFCTLFFAFATNAAASRIHIGMSLSLSGKYAQMGIMQHKGIRLWESLINQKGGLLGRQVQLIVEDDQSSPEKARNIYSKLITRKKVDLVIGPYSSAISEAILPVVEKYQYPVLLSGASADQLWEKGYRYAFGVYTPASKYTVGFLQMLVKHNLKRVAVISADDAFSYTLAENTKKWARRFNITIIASATFKKGRTDLVPVVESVISKNPDVLLVCGHLDESVSVRKALKKLNWYPKAYYASVGPALDQFKESLNELSSLVFSSSQWELDACSKYPFGKEFVTRFTAEYKHLPSYHAATAFAAGMILEYAINGSGTFNRETLRDSLSKIDTMTLIGRFGVDQKGKQRRHFPLIIQWQNQQKKVVWPEQIKTADPIFTRSTQ